jgi:hypothetical protein
MRTSIFVALLMLPACASGPKGKPDSGMFNRDDPNDAPGDVIEGPAGEANSPGLNPPPKNPPKRR